MNEIYINGKVIAVEKDVLQFINELRSKLQSTQDKYHDLIMLVEDKYPGESRHETAVRFMKNYTEFMNQMCQVVKEIVKE